jgi:hypothetical protein
MERTLQQARVNSGSAFKVKVDRANRTISGYTNVTGQLSITWSMWDENFDNIPYRDKQDVIDYAKSYLLQNQSIIMSMQDSDVPNGFNYDNLKDEAERLREKVLDKWQTATKVVVIRG